MKDIVRYRLALLSFHKKLNYASVRFLNQVDSFFEHGEYSAFKINNN